MGHPNFLGKVSDDHGGHVSDESWKAPRLSLALLNAEPGRLDAFKTRLERNPPKDKISLTDGSTFDSQLSALLDHIQDRISIGLDEAWLSQDGYGLLPDDPNATELDRAYSAIKTDQFWQTPEEQWARAFTEMCLYSMYHTPGMAYSNRHNDGEWFRRFPELYSIAMACQTLSTYCNLSRGSPPADVSRDGGGLSCSASTVSLGAFSAAKVKDLFVPPDGPRAWAIASLKKKGQTIDDPPTLAQEAQIEAQILRIQLNTPGWANSGGLIKLGATPGSVLVYNGGGPKFDSQNWPVGRTHIASVLRMSGKRLQFVDTGIVNGEGEISAEGGTVDHGFVGGGKSALADTDSIVAFGVAKGSSDATLVDGVTRLRKTMPIALTRLAIASSDTKRVIFVSKVLHMRWPVSRLIWSLRGLPTKGLDVAWLVYVPGTNADAVKLAEALAGKAPPSSAGAGGDSPPSNGTGKEKPAAPSTFLDAGAELKLANAIIAQDQSPIHIARSHLFTATAGWRYNVSASKYDTPGPVTKWNIDGDTPNRLLDWCRKPVKARLRFLRRPGEDGKANEDQTNHALVDP